MEDNQNDMSINVTELWHKQLFMSLMKIQEYERIARDGASSIEAIFQINRNDIPYVQYQYLRMIITEMDILLSNTKKKLSDKFFEDSTKEIKHAEDILDRFPKSVLAEKYDNVQQSRKYHLTPLYFKMLNTLKDMREGIVQELSDILYGSEGQKKTW
jgi:molecular chaperone DnaK (HSP70)